MSGEAWRERALLFGRQRGLLGIWCEPRSGTPRIPVIILGAGILHRIGPSRVSVHLARALAAQGHPVLRFDLSGIGDSARAAEPTLDAAVTADIRDAIDLAGERTRGTRWEGQVALVGFCSGADNALHVGADDPRVRAAVLFDPTIHRTPGFRRREWLKTLRSPSAWANVLTGRAFVRRWRKWSAPADPAARPPGYYGLLVAAPAEADARARRFREHGGRLRFVLSDGVHRYCNAPQQVREAFPTAFAPSHFEVVWAPHLDHDFATAARVEEFVRDTAGWLADAFPA